MKSGIRNNKTLKLVGATSVTLFSLVSVFVASIAWFSMNKNVDNGGGDIEIKSKEGRLRNVYCHAYNPSGSSESNISFVGTPFASYSYDWGKSSMVPDANNPANWYMGDFTSLDKEHPLLVIFEFDKDYTSSSVGDIYIKGSTTVGGDALNTTYSDGVAVSTTGGGYLGARDSDGGPFYALPQTQVRDETHPESILIKQKTVDSKTRDYYALSSVVSFRNRSFSGNEYQTFSSGDSLNFATSSLETDETFTTIKDDTDEYIFNQNPYLYKSNGSGTVKYVALIIEYYSDAISYIYSTYLGDTGLDSYDSILFFACDWSLEVY